MRIIYSFILYLLTPYAILRLLWRSRRLPGYRQRMLERFAIYKKSYPLAKHCIWIHAVSVGESILAVPLIKRLRQQYPDYQILVTTTTPTGSEQIHKHFQDVAQNEILHLYAPYDLPWAVRRFLNMFKPKIAVMMETELWPNILHYCNKADIPVYIANARLSPKSAKSYARFPKLMKQMLSKVTTVIAQSQADAKRYIMLGLNAKNVVVSGSMKFDLQLPASVSEASELLRQQWGNDRRVWIAASTHEGEEDIILKAFAVIKKQLPDTLLVLVPRHPDRFEKVANLATRAGYKIVLRSQAKACNAQTDIFIGDTMGELVLFYAASDVAFVGGSLVPTGGHNLLEPAALGLPIITGRYMFNFAEITDLLKAAGCITQIFDNNELATAVINYLQDPGLRMQAGEKGKQLIEKNRGAIDKHLAILQQPLNAL